MRDLTIFEEERITARVEEAHRVEFGLEEATQFFIRDLGLFLASKAAQRYEYELIMEEE